MTTNTEIERKFLVDPAFAKTLIGGNFEKIIQFYLTEGYDPTVRIRLVNMSEAYATIKGKANGSECPEFEYKIPYDDGREMRDVLTHTPEVDKHRHHVTYDDGKVWHLDIFHGDNEGLFMAEIELKSKDEKFELPWWCTEEVTEDKRFKNINLSLNPVNRWTTIERAALVAA